MATGRAHCLSELILEMASDRRRSKPLPVGKICEVIGLPGRGSEYWKLGGRRGTLLEDMRRALDILRKNGLAKFVGPKRTGGWSIRKPEPPVVDAAATGSEPPPGQ